VYIDKSVRQGLYRNLMATTYVTDKSTVRTDSEVGNDRSMLKEEKQSLRRLISAITGAAIQSLTEMTDSDDAIGRAMFERWETAQSKLECIKGPTGLLESSRGLKQDLEQAFIRGSLELGSSERKALSDRTRNLLERLDCCIESIR
jgi:hypothetical protein